MVSTLLIPPAYALITLLRTYCHPVVTPYALLMLILYTSVYCAKSSSVDTGKSAHRHVSRRAPPTSAPALSARPFVPVMGPLQVCDRRLGRCPSGPVSTYVFSSVRYQWTCCIPVKLHHKDDCKDATCSQQCHSEENPQDRRHDRDASVTAVVTPITKVALPLIQELILGDVQDPLSIKDCTVGNVFRGLIVGVDVWTSYEG